MLETPQTTAISDGRTSRWDMGSVVSTCPVLQKPFLVYLHSEKGPGTSPGSFPGTKRENLAFRLK